MTLMALHLSVPAWLCTVWVEKDIAGEAVWTVPNTRSSFILIHLVTSSLSLLFTSLSSLNVGSKPAEPFMSWREPVLTSCPAHTHFSPRGCKASHL